MRARRRNKALLVPLALAAISAGLVTALAAQHSPARPPATSLVRQVDRLCAQDLPLLRRVGKLPYYDFDPENPKTSELPAVGAYYGARLPFLATLARQLRELRAPAPARPQWDRLRELVDRYVATATRQVAAARAVDAPAFSRTAATIGDLKDALAASAAALGFTLASPCAHAV